MSAPAVKSSTVAGWAAALIRWSGAASIVRAGTRRWARILVYHDPSPRILEEHLRFLSRRYTFVTLDEIVAAIRLRQRTLPPHALAVTLDDAQRGNAELAEVFRRHGVRPTIFACSGAVESEAALWFMTYGSAPLCELAKRAAHLSRPAVAELAVPRTAPATLDRASLLELMDVVGVGSHSRTHPILTLCDDVTAREEIVEAKHELEATLDFTCKHFSYPNGDYKERERRIFADAGYESARMMDIGWNSPRTDPYRLRVLPTTDDASLTRLVADLSGLLPLFIRIADREGFARKRPLEAA
jgi:peptidoglycan/xylan/chitin deacetylase (PgdA/CDA1 family)